MIPLLLSLLLADPGPAPNSPPAPVAARLAISGSAEVAEYKFVRLAALNADPAAALVWDITPEGELDVEETDAGLTFTGPPGSYSVKLRAIAPGSKRPTQTARLSVTITPRVKPAPVVPPGPVPPPAPPAPVGPSLPPGKYALAQAAFDGAQTIPAPQRAKACAALASASRTVAMAGRGGQIPDGTQFLKNWKNTSDAALDAAGVPKVAADALGIALQSKLYDLYKVQQKLYTPAEFADAADEIAAGLDAAAKGSN